jgi:hypothetical protein
MVPVEVALNGASGDIGVGGDVVVVQSVALEPEHLDLGLDAPIGVMRPFVGQGPAVFRGERDRPHGGTLDAVPRSLLVSSLCRCTASYNMCQIWPRRV